VSRRKLRRSRERRRIPSGPHHEAQSATVNLEAGRPYFVEVLQKQPLGSEHLSVRWRLPDGSEERPIPGIGWRCCDDGARGEARGGGPRRASSPDRSRAGRACILARREPGRRRAEDCTPTVCHQDSGHFSLVASPPQPARASPRASVIGNSASRYRESPLLRSIRQTHRTDRCSEPSGCFCSTPQSKGLPPEIRWRTAPRACGATWNTAFSVISHIFFLLTQRHSSPAKALNPFAGKSKRCTPRSAAA